MIRNLLIAAALVAVAGFASLGADVSADPATCAEPCTIGAHVLFYLPPAGTIEDGDTVTFSNIDDIAHINAETSLSADPCFAVTSTAMQDAPPVRFDIVDGALVATTAPGTPEAVTEPCLGATALPDGSFVLPYRCTLHPDMNGVLVVTPARL